jgi:Zn-dependent protease
LLIPAFLIFTGSPILFGWARPVPYNPYNLKNSRWGEALVAVAGSATNLFLAVVFGLIVRFGGLAGLDITALSIAATISFVNLFLGLFNLIPFPPLDGFTALRGALPWNLARGLHQFENRIRASGVFALILFLLVFSYVLAGPFFKLVLLLFSLLTGSATV